MAALKDGLQETVAHLVHEAWVTRAQLVVVARARLLVSVTPVQARYFAAAVHKRGHSFSAEEWMFFYDVMGPKRPRKNRGLPSLFAYAKAAFPPARDPLREGILRPALMSHGPCDAGDVAAWIAAHLLAVGVPARLTLWRHSCQPDFHHVYASGFVNRRWVAFDPQSFAKAGREPKGGVRFYIPVVESPKE